MKALLLAMALTRSADVTTSLVGFHQGRQEANPLILSTKPAPFIGQMGGEMLVQFWLLRKLETRHPKLARVMGWSSVVASSWAAAHNARGLR